MDAHNFMKKFPCLPGSLMVVTKVVVDVVVVSERM